MTQSFDHVVSADGLAELYRQPNELTQRKIIDYLDDGCISFLASSPYVLIGSSSVTGKAQLTTDPAILDGCTEELRRPKAAIGIQVETAYIHCAKSIRGSELWEPNR